MNIIIILCFRTRGISLIPIFVTTTLTRVSSGGNPVFIEWVPPPAGR